MFELSSCHSNIKSYQQKFPSDLSLFDRTSTRIYPCTAHSTHARAHTLDCATYSLTHPNARFGFSALTYLSNVVVVCVMYTYHVTLFYSLTRNWNPCPNSLFYCAPFFRTPPPRSHPHRHRFYLSLCTHPVSISIFLRSENKYLQADKVSKYVLVLWWFVSTEKCSILSCRWTLCVCVHFLSSFLKLSAFLQSSKILVCLIEKNDVDGDVLFDAQADGHGHFQCGLAWVLLTFLCFLFSVRSLNKFLWCLLFNVLIE